MAGGLTIGQAATFVGVTIKTIRHYHRVGLLDEPGRDSSGYRRYTSTDLLRLVQVRALADTGVALAEIGDILDADPERLAAAVADVGRRISDRIEELLARRDTLHRLLDRDRALLPDRACALLERHTELGFPADYVAEVRDGLILARALHRKFLDGYLTQLEHRLSDPEYVELQKRGWKAASWEPDDPRLDELASAIAANLLTNRELMQAQAHAFSTPDDTARYQVLNNHRADELPTMARLTTLIEAQLRAVGVSIPDH